jgi:hypothetical protein
MKQATKHATKFVILFVLLLPPAAMHAQSSTAPPGSSDQIQHDLTELEKKIEHANFT